MQAQSNISFLSLLKEPCEELARLKFSEIAPKLAHIIKVIRVIWVNSSYYNTRDRITALFGKVPLVAFIASVSISSYLYYTVGQFHYARVIFYFSNVIMLICHFRTLVLLTGFYCSKHLRHTCCALNNMVHVYHLFFIT